MGRLAYYDFSDIPGAGIIQNFLTGLVPGKGT